MTMKINEFMIKVHCAACADEHREELQTEYAKMYLFYAGQEDNEIAEADEAINPLAKETYLKLKAYFEPEEATTENA